MGQLRVYSRQWWSCTNLVSTYSRSVRQFVAKYLTPYLPGKTFKPPVSLPVSAQ